MKLGFLASVVLLLSNASFAESISFVEDSGMASISGFYTLSPAGQHVPLKVAENSATFEFDDSIFGEDEIARPFISLTWTPTADAIAQGLAPNLNANTVLEIELPLLLERRKNYSSTIRFSFFSGSKDDDVLRYENMTSPTQQVERFFGSFLLREYYGSLNAMTTHVKKRARRATNVAAASALYLARSKEETDWFLPPYKLSQYAVNDGILNGGKTAFDLNAQRYKILSLANATEAIDDVMSIGCSRLRSLFDSLTEISQELNDGSPELLQLWLGKEPFTHLRNKSTEVQRICLN